MSLRKEDEDQTAAGETALLIVDMVSCWDFPDGEKLLPGAVAITSAIAALKERCIKAGVPVIYCNDNRGRWRSDFQSLIDLSLACRGEIEKVTRALLPDDEDYFVLKPKHSAFFGTPLDLLLQHLKVRRIVITGVSSDQCILVTAAEARMRDFEVVVPRDCVASQSDKRNETVLLQLENTHNLSTQNSRQINLTPSGKPPS